MTTFVVLLRGVNVGGNNKVPMADLRKAVEAAGYTEARTYVNSGNLVLAGKGDVAKVEKDIEALLAKRFRVDVPVVARTAAASGGASSRLPSSTRRPAHH